MPVSIACPSCSRTLRVGDGLLGRKVKCPGCGHAFVAQAEPPDEEPPAAKEKVTSKPSPSKSVRKPPPPPPPEEEPDEEPQDEEQQEEEQEEDEGRPRKKKKRSRRSEGDFQPHRGALVLILGILSTVFAVFGLLLMCCSPVIGIVGGVGVPFGIVSWMMAARDLKQMREGMMDPEGRGMTTGGLVTGIIGTILGALIALLAIVAVIVIAVFLGGSLYLQNQQNPPF